LNAWPKLRTDPEDRENIVFVERRISDLPPMLNPQKPGFPDWREWGRRVRVDMEKLRQYAIAVYAASEAYLLSLSDGDLNRPVDLSVLGIGHSTLRYVLNMFKAAKILFECSFGSVDYIKCGNRARKGALSVLQQ